MNPESTDAVDDALGVDALDSLRRRVLRATLTVLAVALPIICAFIVGAALVSHTMDTTTGVLSAYSITFPLLRILGSRFGFRWSALLLLGLLALASVIVGARGGVTMGNILVDVLVVLLSTLFFGKRGALIALLAVLLLFMLAGALFVSGILPVGNAKMWDSSTLGYWLREFLVLALLGLAIAVTEVYIVEHLAREARRLRALAEHEQQQRLALERTEGEREQEREQKLAAQKALEESRRIEALARLAGGIAHDFNNTLTVIMGTAEILQSGVSPAEVEQCSVEILVAAKSARELTRQLLTLGRRQISQPRPIAMSEFLGRLATSLRRVLPSDIVLMVESPTEKMNARADPAQLERALFNLAINARDAMPRGGKLTIECRWETVGEDPSDPPNLAAGRYVAISVGDTGEGMAPETLGHIFEPFFTTKPASVGAGLGLATVYVFAKEARGEVRVRSTLSQGTTFTVLLPQESQASAPAVSPAIVATTVAAKSDARVLVVEDRSDVRASIVRILTHDGFQVSEAPDGERALALLAQRKDFALLCIDGVMPGLSTSTVIEQVERLTPAMRILLCSGYLEEDLLRRGVATGRLKLLQKPFTSEELLTSAHELLSGVT